MMNISQNHELIYTVPQFANNKDLFVLSHEEMQQPLSKMYLAWRGKLVASAKPLQPRGGKLSSEVFLEHMKEH